VAIVCNSCRRYFFEPLILKEVHDELAGWPYERIPVCPYCHDTDIEERESEEDAEF
jgi:hypothetical protein